MINKIKKDLHWKIQQIILSGILISIGMFVDAYLRIGHSKLLTMSIYILMGLILPFSLGILTAFLTDVFSMLLQGSLPFWWWSMSLQPILIVCISFFIKWIFSFIKNKKIEIWLNLLFIFLLSMIFITYFSIHYMNFSFDYIGKEKTIEQKNKRIIKNYFSFISFILIIFISLFVIYRNRKNESNNFFLILSIIIFVIFLIDWIYSPLAFMDFQMHSPNAYMGLNGKWNQDLYEAIFYTYILRSNIHILFSILIIPSIFNVWNNIFLKEEINKN